MDRPAMEGHGIFLCYPAHSVSECRGIAKAIDDWGYEVFFYEQTVQAGDEVETKIDQAIKTAAAAIICVGVPGLGRSQNKEVLGLEEEQRRRSGLQLIPFLLSGSDWEDLDLPYFLRIRRAATTLDELRQALAGTKAGSVPEPIGQRWPPETRSEIKERPDYQESVQVQDQQEAVSREVRSPYKHFGTTSDLREWLISRESGPGLLRNEEQQEFFALLPSNPGIYVALAERLVCEDQPEPWGEHLLLRGFVENYTVPKVKAELDRAFDRWLGFIHPAGSPARAGQGAEETKRRLKTFEQRIGQGFEAGETEVAGYRLTVVPKACLLRLARLALAVISSCPGNAEVRAIVRGCLAEAVMDYPEKYDLFAWLFRLSTEAKWSEVEAAARHLIASGHRSAKEAAFRLLSLQGSVEAAALQCTALDKDRLFPPDPAWEKYSDTCQYGPWGLDDSRSCLERTDVPTHLLARHVDPWCPEPSLEIPDVFVERLATEAEGLTPDQVWQGMTRDHRLETLEGPLSAAAPELYARLIRRLVAETSESSGRKIWRWTLEMKEHALFLTDKERHIVYRTWQRLSRKREIDSEERNAEWFLVTLILPQLTASEQLSHLLGRFEDARDLERYEAPFLPLVNMAEIEALLADQDATSSRRARILWFLSANATAVIPEVLEKIPRFLKDRDSLVRYGALRLLYESRHPSAARVLAVDGWRYDPENFAIENHWGSLLLASLGQHLSFEDLRERIGPAYLGFAVQERGLIDEEVQRYADVLEDTWGKALAQDPGAILDFPEAGIEAPVDSAEPVFCRRNLIWERYWHTKGMWFVNPYYHWGRVPDEPSPDSDLKPWGWPSEEQKREREERQQQEIERQHLLGNVWFDREFNTSALPEVVESRSDVVRRWLDVGREQLRLASTFYEGLCGVLLRKSRKEGLSLYWQLKEEALPVRVTVHGIERLDYFLYQAPATCWVLEHWEKRLDQCHTDKELLDLAIVAEHGNGAKWLWDLSQRDLDSSIVRRKARAITLLGFSGVTSNPAKELLESQADGEPVCWLNEVARKAMESWRKNRWTQHWYRRFFLSEDSDQAQAAFLLLLRCVDNRFWGWQERFELPPELPDYARRRAFFRNNRDTLRSRIRENERVLEGTLFGTKVLAGQAEPWLF